MRTFADLLEAVKSELESWFPQQCQNVDSRFYLYYLPTTEESGGTVLIAKEPPSSDYYLATPKPIPRNLTPQQILQVWQPMLQHLPVLLC